MQEWIANFHFICILRSVKPKGNNILKQVVNAEMTQKKYYKLNSRSLSLLLDPGFFLPFRTDFISKKWKCTEQRHTKHENKSVSHRIKVFTIGFGSLNEWFFSLSHQVTRNIFIYQWKSRWIPSSFCSNISNSVNSLFGKWKRNHRESALTSFSKAEKRTWKAVANWVAERE